MRFIFLLIAAMTLNLADPTASALAQETQDNGAPIPLGPDDLVRMDFQNVEIPTLVKFISEITGRNFVLDEKIKGRLSLIAPSEITVDESMIEDAETTLAADGRPGVLVTLDDTGAARLQDLTTRRTSRPVVVVVDGDPVSAPVVLSPLSRLFIITAEDLDASEAEAFTARLAAKPRVQDDM